MKIKYPNFLQINDTIGITATSSGANPKKLDFAIANLKKLGYQVIETSNVRNFNELVSSDGKTRAKEFMELWQNPNVKHIIAARGGEFLMEMLPYLDQYSNQIRITNPAKWVQGFSDTSLLLYYLTTKFKIATVHAENLGDFAMNIENYDLSIKNTIRFLGGDNPFIQTSFPKYQLEEPEEGNWNGYHLTEKVNYELLGAMEQKIILEGRMIGGCIDTLVSLLGTKFDYTKEFCSNFEEGMIWYIDNCELNAADLYRKLWQMRQAGWFDCVNAFLIGRTFAGQAVGDFDLKDALLKALYDIGVPIIYNVDIGHIPPQLTIVNGAFATLKYCDHALTLEQRLL